MTVQVLQSPFDISNAVEAAIETVLRSGQVPEIVVHLYYRLVPEYNSTQGLPKSRPHRPSNPVISPNLTDRILSSRSKYKLVPISDNQFDSIPVPRPETPIKGGNAPSQQQTPESPSPPGRPSTSRQFRLPLPSPSKRPQSVRTLSGNSGLSTPEVTPDRERRQLPRIPAPFSPVVTRISRPQFPASLRNSFVDSRIAESRLATPHPLPQSSRSEVPKNEVRPISLSQPIAPTNFTTSTPRTTPPRETTPSNQALFPWRCQGINQEKIQCRRQGSKGSEPFRTYCHDHDHMAGTPLVDLLAQAKADQLFRDDDAGLCQGLKKGRVQCWNRTGKHLGFCNHHKDQDIQRQPELRSLKTDEELNERVLLENLTVDLVRSIDEYGSTESKTSSRIVFQGLREEVKREPSPLNKPLKQESPDVDESEIHPNYIRPYLSEKANEKVLEKMKQVQTPTEGYIYAYEILNKNTEDHMYIKVGYSNNPERRMKEWKNKCPSNKIVLRGVWPKREGISYGLALHKCDWGIPCQYVRTLERLIDIELKDLAMYSRHILNSENDKPAVLESETPCLDCSTKHKEIYAIRCYAGEPRENIWSLIGLIIEDWLECVRLHCEGDSRKC